MNTRMLLAGLAAGVFSFLLGWVLWDMMGLMDYFGKNTTAAYNALWKAPENMNMIGMVISNLAMGGLVAWMLSRMGATTWMAGFMAAAILGGLITLSLDMFFYSMMNMYTNKTIVIIDVVVSTVTTGLAGAVAGAVLGMAAKKAA
ncbi:MAG: hypothetical protein KA941_03840 [Flavobacteriales bacterium]|nr:hypothetical protein [Flavobacteriales bacterium]